MTHIDVINETQKRLLQYTRTKSECFKNDLGVVPCCLAKPAIFTFSFLWEWNLLVFETSTEKREKHSFEKELTQID